MIVSLLKSVASRGYSFGKDLTNVPYSFGRDVGGAISKAGPFFQKSLETGVKAGQTLIGMGRNISTVGAISKPTSFVKNVGSFVTDIGTRAFTGGLHTFEKASLIGTGLNIASTVTGFVGGRMDESALIKEGARDRGYLSLSQGITDTKDVSSAISSYSKLRQKERQFTYQGLGASVVKDVVTGGVELKTKALAQGLFDIGRETLSIGFKTLSSDISKQSKQGIFPISPYFKKPIAKSEYYGY